MYKSLYIKFAHVRPTRMHARVKTKKEFLKRMECRLTREGEEIIFHFEPFERIKRGSKVTANKI